MNLQNRNRLTDIKNKLMVTRGKEWGKGIVREFGIDIYTLLYLKWIIRNKEGGVERRPLTPSCENTRITTSCWTIINRKTLELTKKDTPHPKTKEKPKWNGRRGAITANSNSITAGWVTHRLEKTYTTEVHPLEWRFWAPRQASQPGGPATGGGYS